MKGWSSNQSQRQRPSIGWIKKGSKQCYWQEKKAGTGNGKAKTTFSGCRRWLHSRSFTNRGKGTRAKKKIASM